MVGRSVVVTKSQDGHHACLSEIQVSNQFVGAPDIDRVLVLGVFVVAPDGRVPCSSIRPPLRF